MHKQSLHGVGEPISGAPVKIRHNFFLLLNFTSIFTWVIRLPTEQYLNFAIKQTPFLLLHLFSPVMFVKAEGFALGAPEIERQTMVILHINRLRVIVVGLLPQFFQQLSEGRTDLQISKLALKLSNFLHILWHTFRSSSSYWGLRFWIWICRLSVMAPSWLSNMLQFPICSGLLLKLLSSGSYNDD